MTPEERSLLERTHKLAEENNEMLRVMRRIHRFSLAFRIAYWVLIIGLTVGAFYFIQPYIDAVFGTYASIFGTNGAGTTTQPHTSNILLDLLK